MMITMLILVEPTREVACDRSLVQTFQLKGLRNSIPDRMEICPTVHDTCCSIMDQIYIVKYWNDYSFPVLRDYNANMFSMFGRIVEFHRLFNKIPREDITVHYVNHRWIPYIHRLCGDTSPASQVETTEKEDIVMLNKIFPGSGKITKLTVEDIPEPPALKLRNVLVDKATILIYLAVINKIVANHYDYRIQLDVLYSLEKDMESMDFRKQVLEGYNFNQLKWDFLNQVKRAKKEIKRSYFDLIKKYQNIPQMKEQLDVIHETYSDKFVKFLSAIERFMIEYNKIKNPFKKYRLISKFKITCQMNLMDVLGYINKAKFELDQEENAVAEKIYGNMQREKLDKEKEVMEMKVRQQRKSSKKKRAKVEREKKIFVKEKLYDPTNDLSVNANVENMADQLKNNWKKSENEDNMLPIDTEDFIPYDQLIKPKKTKPPSVKPIDPPEIVSHFKFDEDVYDDEPSDFEVQVKDVQLDNPLDLTPEEMAIYNSIRLGIGVTKGVIGVGKLSAQLAKDIASGKFSEKVKKGLTKLHGHFVKAGKRIGGKFVAFGKKLGKGIKGAVDQTAAKAKAFADDFVRRSKAGWRKAGKILKGGVDAFKGGVTKGLAGLKRFIGRIKEEIHTQMKLMALRSKLLVDLIKAGLPLDILMLEEGFLYKMLFMINGTKWTIFYNKNRKRLREFYKLRQIPYEYPYVPKQVDPFYLKSMKRFMGEIESKVVTPFIDKKLFTPKEVAPIPLDRQRMVDCKIMGRYLFKNIVINNKYKMRFCFDIHAKFTSFDIEGYNKMLAAFKRENMLMLEIKKTLYCGICDARYQYSFVHDKQLMVFDEDFCQDLLIRFDGYLLWKNLLLIEYMDQFVELINCYETPGNFYDYPVNSFLEKYRQKIWLVKKCFDNKESSKFMMYCHFVCKQFKFKGISLFFDGDEKLVNTFMFKIYNFARKIGIKPLPAIRVIPNISAKELNRDYKPVNKPPKNMGGETDPFKLMEQKISGLYSSIVSSYTKRKYRYSKPIPKKRKYMVPKKKKKIKKMPKGKKGKKNKRIKDKMVRKYAKILEAGRVSGLKRRHKGKIKSAKSKVNAEYTPLGFNNIVPKDIYTKQVIALENTNPVYKKRKLKAVKQHKKEVSSVNPMNLSQVMKLIKKQQKQIIKENEKPPQERQLFLEQLAKDKAKKRFATTKPPSIMTSEIFERKARIYPIDCYRTFYSRNIPAMNPLKMNDLANFDLNSITSLLETKYKKQHPESFSMPAVMNYMQANGKVVNGFNKDIKSVSFVGVDAQGNLKVLKEGKRSTYKKKEKPVENPADVLNTKEMKEYEFAEQYSRDGGSHPSHENLFVHMLHDKHLEENQVDI